MTLDEALSWAKSIMTGGPVKKAEVLSAVAVLMEHVRQPKTDVEIDGMALPELAFEIDKTGSGIHLPREVNASFTKREALALVAKIMKALD